MLIAINPYKRIVGLVGDEVAREYQGKVPFEMAPHVYAIADQAYRFMRVERQNQCIIIRCGISQNPLST